MNEIDPKGDSEHLRKGTFYGFSDLTDAIQTTVQLYEEERQSYHEARLEGEFKIAFQLIDRTAEAILKGASDLASLESVPQARQMLEATRALRKEGGDFFKLIVERFSIRLGWDVSKMVDSGTERLSLLALMMSEVQCTNRGHAFMRRVSRCYIYGFDLECIILCRSVLDVEIASEIDTDSCLRELGPRKCVTLDDRIATAVKIKRLGHEAGALARNVKDVGNAAVHHSPEPKADLMQIIVSTLNVLEELWKTAK